MDSFETVGHIGVDAGIVMFVDPCYIVEDSKWMEFCDELWEKERDHVTEMRGGIVVQTTHGDGSYPVQVKRNSQGQVTEVRVLFDSDEEEDYYYDDTDWDGVEDEDDEESPDYGTDYCRIPACGCSGDPHP